MPCASRRSLRRDTRFDDLIHAVYPDRDAYDRFHEAVRAGPRAHVPSPAALTRARLPEQLLQTISDHTNMRALAESVESGMKVWPVAPRPPTRLPLLTRWPTPCSLGACLSGPGAPPAQETQGVCRRGLRGSIAPLAVLFPCSPSPFHPGLTSCLQVSACDIESGAYVSPAGPAGCLSAFLLRPIRDEACSRPAWHRRLG
jgi:hypothetical protein